MTYLLQGLLPKTTDQPIDYRHVGALMERHCPWAMWRGGGGGGGGRQLFKMAMQHSSVAPSCKESQSFNSFNVQSALSLAFCRYNVSFNTSFSF